MDTKLLKQKILDLAIRGKLVPQDPNDEPASVLLEKIKKEKQELIKQGKIKKDKNESTIYVGDDKQHYEKFADGTVKNIENEIPFDIPETWSWCRFGQLFELRNGFTPLRSNKLFWENGTMPWFTIEDKHRQGEFIKYTSQHITERAYKLERIVPENSVLLCCTASIGEVAFNKIPLITNQQFNGISVKMVYKNLISPMYLYYYCQTLKQFLIEIAGATTFGFVSLSKIEKILLPFPCFSEQQRIVNKIEELFTQVDKIEEEKQSLLKLIDRAKEKVLDLAMKGKLVKQDPNDEPASVLLEKIFEEKKKLAKEGKIKLSKDELLPPQISDDNDYYEKLGYNPDINWIKLQIRDVLYYEQPTKYIVENTNYKNEYKTPVLTAGKSFILGYTNEIEGIYNKLPCIIFDDFTTESKFVDFSFKVKSSAMKILSNNTNVNIKFIYYLMQQIKVNFDTHKRYWISDFSKKEIIIPSLNTQNKLVDCVESFVKYFDNIKAEL